MMPDSDRKHLDSGPPSKPHTPFKETKEYMGNSASEDINAMLEDPFTNVSKEDIYMELRFRIYKLIKQIARERHDSQICRLEAFRSI